MDFQNVITMQFIVNHNYWKDDPKYNLDYLTPKKTQRFELFNHSKAYLKITSTSFQLSCSEDTDDTDTYQDYHQSSKRLLEIQEQYEIYGLILRIIRMQ